MLDFVTDDRKKISYAASFGFQQIPEKYIFTYKSILQNYNKVSIREEEGIELFKKLTGREDAKLVLDPTMLLKKNDWLKLAKVVVSDKPYVLVYQLGSSKNLLKFASKLAKKNKLRLLVLPHAFGSVVNAKWCLGRGPQEWLGLFFGASYIVTNSFHGTAFSINLNKDFFVEVSEKCKRVSIQSRVYNLLNIFHLEDRLIPDSFEIIEEKRIDYQKVNDILNDFRENSLNYLRGVFK